MLCYLTRQEMLLMKLCNGNTWINTLNSLLHREHRNTSFIRCFPVTAENLIWLTASLFFFSWWPAEEYLFAALLKCQFLCFFTKLDLIWPKFCPKDHTKFALFADFQWNMLGDSTDISTKKGIIMGHAQHEKQFSFCRNNKSRSSAFILSKYHMFWLSYESFSILSGAFYQKKVSFPAKTGAESHALLLLLFRYVACLAS